MKMKEKVVRPGGLELPTFWFVANGVNMLNALFGVAYGLETPFFPQLAALNVAPKTELYRIRKLTNDLFQLSRRSRRSKVGHPPFAQDDNGGEGEPTRQTATSFYS